MKKNINVIFIFFFSVLTIFFTFILVLGIISKNRSLMLFSSFSWNQDDIKEEESIDLTGIQKVILDLKHADVQFLYTDETKIKIVKYSKGEKNYDNSFSILYDKDTVSIKDNKSTYFFLFCFGKCREEYKVYIPKEYKNELEVSLVSGDLYSKKPLEISKFYVHMKSGDVYIKNMNSKVLSIETISGDQSVEQVNVKEINLISKSGDVNLLHAKADVNVNLKSGEVSIRSLTGSLKAEATSGDITINDFYIVKDSSITSHSGDITLILNKKSNCEFIANTKSGSILYPNKSHKIGKKPYHSLFVETKSGDIDLSE